MRTGFSGLIFLVISLLNTVARPPDTDPGPLSAFWAELLGGRSPADVATGSVPKQAHIDLDVDDLDQTEKRAVSLGAVRADSQPAPEEYLVLFDPAGRPFCLSIAFPK